MSNASTLSAINEAMQDPIPKMQESPDTSVELLCGIRTGEGWEASAVVREMTGEDEEYLASLETRSTLNYPEYMSALLKRTVVSIGDINVAKNPNVIDDLIIGDRDLLFLSVIKATYGRVRKYPIVCQACKGEVDLTVDMVESFPVQGSREEALTPLVVTLKNGKEITLRLPTGADTKAVMKRGKNPAEQNTLMISRCAVLPMDDVSAREKWARSLNIADRNALVAALLSVKLGPKTGEVNDPCPHCGETIHAVLDWVSLLFG